MKHVYVFELKSHVCKIGISKDIDLRMRNIANDCKEKIINTHFTKLIPREIAALIERACHEKFAEYRLSGEYFDIAFADACAELDKYADETGEAYKSILQKLTPEKRAYISFRCQSSPETLSLLEQTRITIAEGLRIEALAETLVKNAGSTPEQKAELVRRLRIFVEGVKLGLILQTPTPNDAA